MNEPNEGGYDRHEVREPNGPRGGYVVSDRSPGGSFHLSFIAFHVVSLCFFVLNLATARFTIIGEGKAMSLKV